MKEQTISNLKKLKSFHNGSFGADIDRAIQALEQQPCEDCISRAAVLDKKELVELEDGQSFYSINPKDVETLPSVTPQPKSGEWIDKGYDIGNCWATCSECDGYARGYAKDTGWGHDYYFPKFCPHCGARMNGGGEDAKQLTE